MYFLIKIRQIWIIYKNVKLFMKKQNYDTEKIYGEDGIRFK